MSGQVDKKTVIKDLIEQGKQKGSLSNQEILDAIGEIELSPEQLEKDAQEYPLMRYGKPEEIAWGIIYLLSDASSFVTGTNLVIDGGISAKL